MLALADFSFGVSLAVQGINLIVLRPCLRADVAVIDFNSGSTPDSLLDILPKIAFVAGREVTETSQRLTW
jgi:hypothetical protein